MNHENFQENSKTKIIFNFFPNFSSLLKFWFFSIFQTLHRNRFHNLARGEKNSRQIFSFHWLLSTSTLMFREIDVLKP